MIGMGIYFVVTVGTLAASLLFSLMNIFGFHLFSSENKSMLGWAAGWKANERYIYYVTYHLFFSGIILFFLILFTVSYFQTGDMFGLL